MKKFFLFLLFAFVFSIANSQDCFWAKNPGSTDNEQGMGIVSDNNGNAYITGHFAGQTINFGSVILQNKSIPNYSYYDIYIAKYDVLGNVIWAKNFGGSHIENSNAIAIDAAQNLYITGYFLSDTLIFGNDTLFNYLPSGSAEFFIAKVDSNGNSIWAKKAIGTSIAWDMGNGIIADAQGNCYITGKFHSDSIMFGNVTLNKIPLSTTDLFVAKYDTAGNVVWAKNAGGSGHAEGSGVAVDSVGNVYITGMFEAWSIAFGNSTLTAGTPGNENYFVAKYDPTGNAVWAEGAVTNAFTFGAGIVSDGINVYTTGTLNSGPVTFDTSTVQSYGGRDIFLVSYHPDGQTQWATSIGTANDEIGFGIAVDANKNLYFSGGILGSDVIIGKYDSLGNPKWTVNSSGGSNTGNKCISVSGEDDVYIAGSFYSSLISFGSTTLNNNNPNSSYYDIYLAHNYGFSTAITSSANIFCNGGSNGSASASFTGGIAPISFLWSNNDTSSIITDLSAGNYSVTATDINGCSQSASVSITQPPPDSANICLVTVDSLSQNNIIVWDKTNFTDVDSFIVYREISTNNYQPIASIPFDSLSQFVDTVRTLYFPNTGDPNAGTYRYKIQVHDTCGGYSELSPFHNTIFFMENNGIFNWPQLYTIENGANPVSSYVLMRDDSSNGNWNVINSVAGTQQFITDPQYSQYKDIASWRISTQWNLSCTPTFKVATDYNASLSNIYTNSITSINGNSIKNDLIVFPNPASEVIFIHCSNQKIQMLEINNILGELVFSSDNKFQLNTMQIDMSDFTQGMFFLKIKTSDGIIVKEIFKE